MGKVDWQKTVDTLTAGASESGGAIWGMLGRDVITDREAELAKEQMKLDAAMAEAQAIKDAALYEALSNAGKSSSSSSSSFGSQAGRIQRPRPAGMPAVRTSESSFDQKTVFIALAVALGLYIAVKK